MEGPRRVEEASSFQNVENREEPLSGSETEQASTNPMNNMHNALATQGSVGFSLLDVLAQIMLGMSLGTMRRSAQRALKAQKEMPH